MWLLSIILISTTRQKLESVSTHEKTKHTIASYGRLSSEEKIQLGREFRFKHSNGNLIPLSTLLSVPTPYFHSLPLETNIEYFLTHLLPPNSHCNKVRVNGGLSYRPWRQTSENCAEKGSVFNWQRNLYLSEAHRMSILHHFKGPSDPTGCILGVRLVCSVSQKIAQSLKSSLRLASCQRAVL